MRKLFLLFIITFFLHGDFFAEGELIAAITEVFSIVISKKTSSHHFTAQEITNNNNIPIEMGAFSVIINDTSQLSGGGSNQVKLASLFFENSTVQLKRIQNQGSGTDLRVNLIVTDDHDSSGNEQNTNISQGGVIRRRSAGDAPIIDEIHNLTFKAQQGELNASNAGNYRTTIYFCLESS